VLYPRITGVVFGNLLGECAVRRTRKRRLPHSAADLWNAILTMTKQCLEGNPGLTKHSRDPVPSTLRSCSAVKQPPIEAIAAITQVRVQDTSPCKPKTRGPLRAYPVQRRTLLLARAPPIASKRVGIVVRSISANGGDKVSELTL